MAGVGNQLKAIPIKELIGAPFVAVMESQIALAQGTKEYIDAIGFDEEEKLKTISFDLPAKAGVEASKPERIEAPLLAMVPVPSLMIDKVSVDFQMEIKASFQEHKQLQKSQDETLDGVQEESKSRTTMIGKLSEAKNSTRKTNQSAKYQFHVEASLQPQPEGLNKMLDLLVARMSS